MRQECQESKRRNLRKTPRLPSLQLLCQPLFIRPAVASTVCFTLTVAITQGGAIQLANNGTDGVQGLQTLTMTNAAAAQPGTTILQYAQTSDGQQILVPSNQVVVQAASGDVQAYQIRTAAASTIGPGVVMASSPALPSQGGAEEATRKREVRLMKNREAARECRRKKKEYVKCLENRVAVLENQNKTLIEELKALKDLYCHKSE
ncbi:cyclic AMP-responsive element-binding protein 1b isoform X3 [Neoarius graeffei]|uniref:cyclic AMP-responsive element-binding protein 1b isoform X3 n=1 Tax=Neoarius graeffei TaxID=443677 RepID=UPI00298BFD4F|nr:cyclic AMP-responsive element-binding protein 1b isoform X3 [Neoarius graeffei]